MTLAIDIGNTRTKAALFEENRLLKTFVIEKIDWKKSIATILHENTKITTIVVSSVGNVTKKDFEEWENRYEVVFLDVHSKFPFTNLYQTPNTLGIDRMLVASGAVLQHPNRNRLVIDAGTCITYDFVNASNEYLGGAISPGIHLRYEALHTFTAKLPLLTMEHPNYFIGNDTKTAIHSGVINGVLNEIKGFITAYEEEYSNFIIILTGGDSEFLANRLKNTIFANPNFLLESLYETYQYLHQK